MLLGGVRVNVGGLGLPCHPFPLADSVDDLISGMEISNLPFCFSFQWLATQQRDENPVWLEKIFSNQGDHENRGQKNLELEKETSKYDAFNQTT